MHTIIEPFRIKMTEPLPITTRAHREAALTAAHNNVFLLDAEHVTIDLLTDEQWHQWDGIGSGPRLCSVTKAMRAVFPGVASKKPCARSLTSTRLFPPIKGEPPSAS